MAVLFRYAHFCRFSVVQPRCRFIRVNNAMFTRPRARFHVSRLPFLPAQVQNVIMMRTHMCFSSVSVLKTNYVVDVGSLAVLAENINPDNRFIFLDYLSFVKL